MRTTRTVIGIVVIALVAAASLVWSGHAAEQNEAARTDATNRFAGKYMIVRTDRTLDERGAYLTDVRVETIGGESFLVGKGIALQADWKRYEGRTIWVAVRHIEQMYEFKSLEELKSLYERDDR